jgi:cellulose synthase/poly-beta-1,6-N-acetylglucosamine synthase-like glycosyltransferase
MWYAICLVCLVLYLFCSAWFLAGSLVQMHLLWHVFNKKREPVRASSALPSVTVQVPVYNERYVITRLLESLGRLNYPTRLFEIQILDDSTDDTTLLVDAAAEALRLKSLKVEIIRRSNRTGYKAGALQEALPLATGELIAIFDADFIPPENFLQKMVQYFDDPDVGGVQGRWVHDNLDENILTRIQAFLLDSHFQLEQQGRDAAGYFLNFNGTAGIWRKQCIEEAGGWNGNILTEDLELSYRAQLKGWKFKYDNEMTVPAELPADIDAFKSQQFRWAKGMAQTAGKHLGKVMRSHAPLIKKVHAFFHLLGSLSFVAVMGNIILAIPVNAGRHYIQEYAELTSIIMVTGITLPLICVYYYFGTSDTLSRKIFWQYLPMFLIIYMALSVQNSVAVIQGLMGHRSAFVRTPKTKRTNTIGNAYTKSKWTMLNTFEAVVALYVCAAIVMCVYWKDYLLLIFLLMVLSGLAILLSKGISGLFQKRTRIIIADPI